MIMFKYSGEKGFGWIPDYPDFRDYTPESTELSLTHQKLGLKKPVKKILKDLQPKNMVIPPKRDLRNSIIIFITPSKTQTCKLLHAFYLQTSCSNL